MVCLEKVTKLGDMTVLNIIYDAYALDAPNLQWSVESI
jgi:hypothetical protein